MKEFLEKQNISDLKKIAKKFKLDTKAARLVLINNLNNYVMDNSIEQSVLEEILVKKVKEVVDKTKDPEDVQAGNEESTDKEPKEIATENQEDFKNTTDESEKEITEEIVTQTEEFAVEESLLENLEEKLEETIIDAKEVLSDTAHKWYKYLGYMKGKKTWEDFFKYLDSKAQNSFKFKEYIQEIKDFLKIK